MGQKLGLDAVLNIQTDGVSGSVGWTEVTNISDLELNITKATVDNTTRANNGWRSRRGTLKEGDISFTMNYDPDDADFQAFKSAFFGNTHIGLQVFDGPSNPGGLIADFDVSEFNVKQALEDMQKVDVKLQVTFVDTAPAWQDPA